ncbi:unnamed protein product [Amoebophrya sp. A120]|nr:unnamed protein product [Amoebophrya sp. A120]|eukprot:GSA120T00001480001.1
MTLSREMRSQHDRDHDPENPHQEASLLCHGRSLLFAAEEGDSDSTFVAKASLLAAGTTSCGEEDPDRGDTSSSCCRRLLWLWVVLAVVVVLLTAGIVPVAIVVAKNNEQAERSHTIEHGQPGTGTHGSSSTHNSPGTRPHNPRTGPPPPGGAGRPPPPPSGPHAGPSVPPASTPAQFSKAQDGLAGAKEYMTWLRDVKKVNKLVLAHTLGSLNPMHKGHAALFDRIYSETDAASAALTRKREEDSATQFFGGPEYDPGSFGFLGWYTFNADTHVLNKIQPPADRPNWRWLVRLRVPMAHLALRSRVHAYASDTPEFFAQKRLSADLYAHAVRLFGEANVVKLDVNGSDDVRKYRKWQKSPAVFQAAIVRDAADRSIILNTKYNEATTGPVTVGQRLQDAGDDFAKKFMLVDQDPSNQAAAASSTKVRTVFTALRANHTAALTPAQQQDLQVLLTDDQVAMLQQKFAEEIGV